MTDVLIQQTYKANMLLPASGLVKLTWGNVSGIDRKSGLVVIKPSGVVYEDLKPENMAVVRLDDGERVSGQKPSSDTPTHLELYRAFPEIGGVCHTHSTYATIFAQARRPVPALGTTHADYFYGDVPVTGDMTAKDIADDYEKNTGKVIAELFRNLSYKDIPAVLVGSHGPFTWGGDAMKAVENSIVLEEVAFMAYHALMLTANSYLAKSHEFLPIKKELLDKHFLRKHGSGAYYGQV